MLVLGCSTPMLNGDRSSVLKPNLKYGWSPVMSIEIDGKDQNVKCMTTDDSDLVMKYMLLLEYRVQLP